MLRDRANEPSVEATDEVSRCSPTDASGTGAVLTRLAGWAAAAADSSPFGTVAQKLAVSREASVCTGPGSALIARLYGRSIQSGSSRVGEDLGKPLAQWAVSRRTR